MAGKIYTLPKAIVSAYRADRRDEKRPRKDKVKDKESEESPVRKYKDK